MKKLFLFLSILFSSYVITVSAENYDQNYPLDFKIIPWYSDEAEVAIVIPNPHADNRMIFIQVDDYGKVNVTCNGQTFFDVQNVFTCKSRMAVSWSNALYHGHSSGTFQITPIL